MNKRAIIAAAISVFCIGCGEGSEGLGLEELEIERVRSGAVPNVAACFAEILVDSELSDEAIAAIAKEDETYPRGEVALVASVLKEGEETCEVFGRLDPGRPPAELLIESIENAVAADPAVDLTSDQASCVAETLLDSDLADITLIGLAADFDSPEVATADANRVEGLVATAARSCIDN